MKKLLITLVAAMSVVVFTGCGESSSSPAATGGSVDINKPVADVQAEAAKMDTAALNKQAEAYQAEIAKKTTDIQAKTKELSDVPLTEVLGDKAKNLKNDIAAKTKDIDALKARMQVYLDEAKKKAAQ